jgi:hypothetical protein
LAGNGWLWTFKQLTMLAGMGLAIVVVLALLVAGPLNDKKAGCTFYGDSLALGATVYVDGKWLGVMEPGTQPDMTTLRRRVPRGERQVLVVSRTGDSLAASFRSKAEATVWFSFADSSIGD